MMSLSESFPLRASVTLICRDEPLDAEPLGTLVLRFNFEDLLSSSSFCCPKISERTAFLTPGIDVLARDRYAVMILSLYLPEYLDCLSRRHNDMIRFMCCGSELTSLSIPLTIFSIMSFLTPGRIDFLGSTLLEISDSSLDLMSLVTSSIRLLCLPA